MMRDKIDKLAAYYDEHDTTAELEQAVPSEPVPADEVMIVTSLRLPKPVMDQVRERAQERGVKPTALIQAAILGAEDFDVTTIDETSVTLQGVPAVYSASWDIIMPVDPAAEPCACISAGHDKYKDLVLWFNNNAVIEALGDVDPGEVVKLTVAGRLADGGSFSGMDCAVMVTPEEQPLASSTPSLSGNSPNPFNPTTEISFTLPKATHVTLRIVNVMGQVVATLVDERMEAGSHRIQWNASGFASGIYFCTLEAGGRKDTQKMVLLK